LRKKIVAIPLSVTPTGLAVAKLVAAGHGALMLGAPTAAQLKIANAAVEHRQRVYSQQVDLDRAKSVSEFFQIAVGQFGRLDAIVVETVKPATRATSVEKLIELSARRLLHCLDAALEYADGDLHVVNISPVAGRFAMQVATAFLGAKLATAKLPEAPRLRMSVVSPSNEDAPEDGSLARTIVHLMKEPHSPDVTEIVLPRLPVACRYRQVKVANGRGKPSLTM
jgi:NADP-dependent 3-hydroxy acid dehydrogenase YdfG